MKELREIPLDIIDDPEEPVRSYMTREPLDELVESIKRFGVIHPIVVKQVGDRYEVIVGHRRLQASKMAGKLDIPCYMDDGFLVEPDLIKLEENIVREDVSPMDIAKYIVGIMKTRGLSQADVARKMNKTPAYVSKILKLLDCDELTQSAVDSGKLTYHSAVELQRIDDPVLRRHLTQSAVQIGAKTPLVNQWVNDYVSQKEAEKRKAEGQVATPLAPAPPPQTIKCPCCNQRYVTHQMLSGLMCSWCFNDFTTLVPVGRAQGYFQGGQENDRRRDERVD